MSHVATLIAGPTLDAGKLVPLVELAARALVALGAEIDQIAWLAPGRAADLPFAGVDPDQADAAIRTSLEPHPVDVIAQPAAGRRKRLLLADMESTIIGQEMLDELAEHRGIRAEITEITRRAMNGEIEFKAALAERVALLKDLPEAVLTEMESRIVPNPGAAELIATMRSSGARTVLVSGGFTRFTSLVRADLGFDEDRANVLEVADGKLTGHVLDPIRDKDDKLRTLIEQAASLRLSLSETAAIGDGANDLPMLQAAGLGVAYHAKPAVRAVVQARLDHADLTGLLYAQGFRADEIVTS